MKRESHVSHPKLGAAYLEGYEAGMIARANAFGHASKKFGYVPSILRVDDTNETGGMSAGKNGEQGEERTEE